ncbi:ABC transporter ATP-binding protein [Enorma phocaeensis]|uniref:ABC transporter ATP-binding protein n=1 Tax=Enorma phocaeensis TaxID=1871019 RepID=UPI0019571F56|nr:ABC transporter ATP-binding protein [Enorma phocaeensis]MBM6953737.1 ABC transporter ATP-binding protein [Enorma phocaeensis]
MAYNEPGAAQDAGAEKSQSCPGSTGGQATSRQSWAARVIGFTGGGRWLIYLSMALSVLSSACTFVPFVAVYLVVADVIAVYPDFSALDAARMAGFGWMAVAGVVANIGLYLAALLCAHSAAFDAEYHLKLQIVEHLARVPLGRLEALGTGRVGKIMDESVGAIEGYLAHSLPDTAAAFTAPVAIVVLLFVFDWRFGLAAVACVVAAFGVEAAGFSNKAITEKMRRHLVNQERMSNATVEYVRGMPVVKTFGQTAESFGRLSEAVRAYTDLALDVALFWQSLMPAFTAIINNAYLFILPVGIALGAGLDGESFRAFALDFIFYLLFVPSIAGALNKMMYISEDSMIITAQLARIDEVLGIEPVPAPRAGEARVPERYDVELDDVCFSYGAAGEGSAGEKDGAPAGPLALDHVSLAVPAGTTLAIVGPSGAGKSTVASLVARFWDVDAGAVRIGGVDVRDIDPDDLMGCMSLVFQDVHLFRASLLENIRMARPDATREEVVEAARAAQADAFIRALPQGYDTVFGSAGVHLSGGEAQRVSIARAILADRPIVVLDEATAFSDPENEHLIQLAFERLMAGKTVIMIAHRLSTVVGADQIAVVDGGRVAERGRHEGLLAARGAYARMWARYTQALSWGIESNASNDKEVA